ncbi:MAG: SIMPL domain-containing protein [Candidatus Aenigmatarchaeota archaeon]
MKNIAYISIIIIAIVIVAGILITLNIPKEEKTIEVTGNAEIETMPTQTIIYLGYRNTNKTSQEAEQENARVVANIKAALGGIEIETDSYYINPEYNWSSGRQEIIGYTAVHRLKLTIRNLSVGEWITKSVQAGANFVDSIQYDITEEERNNLKAEALRQASQAAKAKAESIASGLGLRVLGVKSVADTSWDWFPWIRTMAYEVGKTEMPEIPTPIEVGKVKVTASVRAIFEIG